MLEKRSNNFFIKKIIQWWTPKLEKFIRKIILRFKRIEWLSNTLDSTIRASEIANRVWGS